MPCEKSRNHDEKENRSDRDYSQENGIDADECIDTQK